ncbi:MAG: response regulator [Cyanobacteria bacterium J06650_10]
MNVETISIDASPINSVVPEKSLIAVSSEKDPQHKTPSITQDLDDKLQAHFDNKFVGIVYVVANQKVHWKLYFRSGQLKWAVAKDNQKRSWYRQVRLHYLLLLDKISRENGVHNSGESFPHHKIAYPRLIKQLQARKIEGIPLAKAVESYLREILFDILQEGALRQKYGEPLLSLVDKEKKISSARLLSVRIDSVWQQAQDEWQAWQQAGLLNCSPTLKPVISQTQQLKDFIPEEVYQCLSDIVQDNLCLRDLAVDLNQDLLSFTKRINPFIQQGMIGLVAIRDFGAEEDQETEEKVTEDQETGEKGTEDKTIEDKATEDKTTTESTIKENAVKLNTKSKKGPKNATAISQSKRKLNSASKASSHARTQLKKKQQSQKPAQPLIVHVEDSWSDSQRMEAIVQTADCDYLNIQESMHAIPLLIEKKPQLIFLDLVMPIANGYEICAQIRRVSSLKRVPIVIVTSNSGVTDWLRSKITGASGFLSKPIDSEKVLKIINKFI